MNAYLLPGLTGLALGLTLRWTGFSRPDALKHALALRRSHALRSGLYAAGWSMLLAALLCWLAVIDVDRIEVLPLNGAVLAGAMLFGAAAGLCGFTPTTALAGLGGGAALEALCTAAGCLAATLLLPALDTPLTALQSAGPQSAATLFRMTLDEPWLLEGGFLGQGCAGLLVMSIAVCIPSPRIDMPEPAPAPATASDPPLPEDAPEETFVALLPGEEPLVVDTELDGTQEAAPPEEAAEADDLPSEEESGPADDPVPEENPPSEESASSGDEPDDDRTG